jgi:DNA-binding CsgD family transcriptional regulator/PAS domain-containing protein
VISTAAPHATIDGISYGARRDPSLGESPPASIEFDEDSYEPLASISREFNRELESHGTLVMWHNDGNPPLFLFAEGACEPYAVVTRDVADITISATQLRHTGSRSQWRTLSDDPSSAVLMTSIPAEGGTVTITSLFKRFGPSTRVRASETAARLLPFVQPFFRTWTLRLKDTAALRALKAAVNNSEVGILLVDRNGLLVFANNVAEGLFASMDGVRRKGALITGTTMANTMRLHAAIDDVVAPKLQGSEPASRIVALPRRKGRALIAAVVANDDPKAASADCAIIIYIVDPDQDLQGLVEPVCTFYGLSPVETRLACLLATGCSLAAAAEQMHVREQTARTYLKQVFLKTDTHRQVQLVRLLLASAVRTAPHR